MGRRERIKESIIEKRLLNIELDNNIIIRSISSGLTMAMPILMIGSMSLVLRTILKVFNIILSDPSWLKPVDYLSLIAYDATFGMMALYMVFFISLSYMQQFPYSTLYIYGAPLVSIAGFIIFSGGLGEDAITNFGVKGMFTAIVSAIIASFLYRKLSGRFVVKKLYTEGADVIFNNSLACIIPMVGIVLIFTTFNSFIEVIFGVSNFQSLFVFSTNLFFENMGRSPGSGLLFVFLSSFLWFFGVHGTNVLENVTLDLFKPGVDINRLAIEGGKLPTEIFTKDFFDIFVFMGGCGSLMCMLIALLLFSKRGSSRYLGKMAAIPALFNVNELLVFGLPVVFNPYLFVPFILTPIINMFISFAAMYWNLVPMTAYSVEWTTPVLFSGYFSTGSIAGCLLQLVNLCIGVFIYRPFLRLYDKSQLISARKKLDTLVKLLQDSEEDNQSIVLIQHSSVLGNVAKMIAMDLKRSLHKKEIHLYYQPQYDERNRCIGAEALMRWNHARYGMVYPPLVIKLAEEVGILGELERFVFQTVSDDVQKYERKYGKGLRFSVNLSVKTLKEPSFEQFLQSLVDKGYVSNCNLCIEITEQMAMRYDEELLAKFENIRTMGFLLAIDDFSMGNTSLKYLQSNQFDEVKLDGSLVKNLNKNLNSEEIIKSIVYLSKSLSFTVLAEYVETEELRSSLEKIGCNMYQGYLYSKALPYDEFCARVEKDKSEKYQ